MGRASRHPILLHLPEGREAARVNEAMLRAIAGLPAVLVRSRTWNQGKQLASHAAFTIGTGVKVRFCDPRSPWWE